MIIKKITPQSLLNSPNIIAITSKPIVEMTKNGKSLLIKILSTVKVPSNAETPTTAKMLKMLLPITFPNDIALVPANAEVIETAASGALVPNATIVKPTIMVGIFKLYATLLAPSTNTSAPLIKSTNPIISKIICNINSINSSPSPLHFQDLIYRNLHLFSLRSYRYD